jgi:hypothetical protein
MRDFVAAVAFVVVVGICIGAMHACGERRARLIQACIEANRTPILNAEGGLQACQGK